MFIVGEKITSAVGVSAISFAVILNNHTGRNVLEKRHYFDNLRFQMQDTFLLTAEGMILMCSM